MSEALKQQLPKASWDLVEDLLSQNAFDIKIKKERKTRHGDFRQLPNGESQITINSNLNPFRFLMTLVHEIAHFKAYDKYGKFIKPHGKEWKQTFQHLMLPFIRPEIFPDDILPLLAKHFKNPKASSDSDKALALALKQFDEPNDKTFIFEVPEGASFRLYNGRIFKRGIKRRVRIECLEIATGKIYLFNPNAEVDLI
ncbi:SprT-like domain-containing protein [Winogradskyella maritima]|uniref:SprT-like domain-containing protein n=1 Tax=Winogradskyella maritima TaxID=1517766 RepID=A0ABV8AKU1_9FLAO|nr:SprT-like domain-containing protein [Winogradskyella maritima]